MQVDSGFRRKRNECLALCLSEFSALGTRDFGIQGLGPFEGLGTEATGVGFGGLLSWGLTCSAPVRDYCSSCSGSR